MSKSVFMFAAICGFAIVSVPGQELRAQDKNQAEKQDDSQQRGRFLRRLREDIRNLTGSEEDEKEKAKQRESTASRTPTPASRSTATALNPTTGRFDGISTPETNRGNPQDRATGFRMSDLNPMNLGGQDSAPAQRPRKGFGLTIEEKGDQLVVDSLDRSGNAAEADFRRGDVIVEIGGVPIKTIAEFDEITGILGEGDQIEVSIVRGGKEEKKLLQLGSVPEAAAIPAVETMRGPSLTPSLASDFVPNYSAEPDPRFARQTPGTDNRGLGSSVLERGPTTQQVNQNSVEILQMQETIRRQQVVIDQLQKELQSQQGSNRRKN